MPNQQTAKGYITSAMLRARWGNCSHMFIERRLKDDPAFPRPMKLGGSSIRLWDEAEITAYERACVAARTPPPPSPDRHYEAAPVRRRRQGRA